MTTLACKAQPKTMPAQPSIAEFEVVFDEHWPRVHGVLFRIVGDPAEAEDLALEVFLRLHRQPRLLESGHNVGGWLYRVATNLGYNALRAAQRRKRYETEAGHLALEHSNAADPAVAAGQNLEREQVRRILAQMKPRSARLLILRHSGFSYANLAEALNLAPNSVGKLLSRAEKDFEKRYQTLYGTRNPECEN